MSRQITFLPSGRTCPVEAQETVLEACLRAGLTPAYGCSNGNCGDCKARLVAGDVVLAKHHDYALSMSQKDNGHFLMCANRVLGNIEIEADVTRGPEDIPVQEIETRVKGIEFLDSQVAKLHLQTPRSRRLRFISGQSVSLTLGEGIETRQSLASCPCDDRNLLFHVPLLPDDGFSEAIFGGEVKPRDTVCLTGPHGKSFFLDESDSRPSVFLCWHTSFAPILSLIEHAMSLELEQDIHLFRFSPTPDQQYLPNLGRAWSDAYDNVSAYLMEERLTLMSSPKRCEEALSGIAEQFGELSKFNAYVSGPPNFIEAAHNVFGGRGLGIERIRTHTDWLGIV